jgi:hypothetical protein
VSPPAGQTGQYRRPHRLTEIFEVAAEVVLHDFNQLSGFAVRGFKRRRELVELAAGSGISTAAAELASSPKMVFMYSPRWLVPRLFFSKLRCISFRMANIGRVLPLLSDVLTPSSLMLVCLTGRSLQATQDGTAARPRHRAGDFGVMERADHCGGCSILTPAFFATGAA